MSKKENKQIYKDEFDKIWVDILFPLLNEFANQYGLKYKYNRYIDMALL